MEEKVEEALKAHGNSCVEEDVWFSGTPTVYWRKERKMKVSLLQKRVYVRERIKEVAADINMA